MYRFLIAGFAAVQQTLESKLKKLQNFTDKIHGRTENPLNE